MYWSAAATLSIRSSCLMIVVMVMPSSRFTPFSCNRLRGKHGTTRQARETVLWKKPFSQTLDESNAPFYKWFADGTLNVSYNCLDRHLTTQPDKVAVIFEADDGKVTKVTYKDLHARVCKLANGLKS